MKCPKCGGEHVDVQLHQEARGSTTVSKSKSRYREVGHGCLWWLLIGWWWWIVDLCLWIFFFLPRLVIQLFKKKKYKGTSQSVENTVNHTTYRSVCVCKDCGYNWTVDR